MVKIAFFAHQVAFPLTDARPHSSGQAATVATLLFGYTQNQSKFKKIKLEVEIKANLTKGVG